MSKVCNGCPILPECQGSNAVDCERRDIIAARDKEWVAMLEKYFGDLPATVAQFKKDMGVSQ